MTNDELLNSMLEKVEQIEAENAAMTKDMHDILTDAENLVTHSVPDPKEYYYANNPFGMTSPRGIPKDSAAGRQLTPLFERRKGNEAALESLRDLRAIVKEHPNRDWPVSPTIFTGVFTAIAAYSVFKSIHSYITDNGFTKPLPPEKKIDDEQKIDWYMLTAEQKRVLKAIQKRQRLEKESEFTIKR